MEVKAIDNLSLMNFEGKSRNSQRKNIRHSHPQMDAPASEKSARAMRNMIMGLMALGAATTSCNQTDIDVEYDKPPVAIANAAAWAYAAPGQNDTVVIKLPGDTIHDTVHDTITVRDTVNNVVRDSVVVRDTIYNTIRDTVVNTITNPVYIKDYPWALGDSLIAQGRNIGIEPKSGLVPGRDGDDIGFIGSVAYNEYDYQLYETKLDSIFTNGKALSLLTKVTDFYDDPQNPKVSFIRTMVTDVPGRGIKLERWVSDPNVIVPTGSDGFPEADDASFNYEGYEIRTNNKNGKNNSGRIYERLDGLPNGREVKYVKGNQAGSFTLETIAYDKNGIPYTDENGMPEWVSYDYTGAKTNSARFKKYEGSNGTEYQWK